MPFKREQKSAGGTQYGFPFIDGPRDVEQITVDLSTLTYADGSGGEVDGDGYIIPGTPLNQYGDLIGGTVTDEYVYGVVIAPVYVGSDPIDADADLDSLTDIQVAVARAGLVNRDVVEDNLGRAINANEVTAFAAAGSGLALSSTGTP